MCTVIVHTIGGNPGLWEFPNLKDAIEWISSELAKLEGYKFDLKKINGETFCLKAFKVGHPGFTYTLIKSKRP
jgi:hypothetical protein